VDYDHVTKVTRAQNGLRTHIQVIKERLSHPNCTPADRKALAEELGNASRLLDRTTEFMR
jgi:hypothetical protein